MRNLREQILASGRRKPKPAESQLQIGSAIARDGASKNHRRTVPQRSEGSGEERRSATAVNGSPGTRPGPENESDPVPALRARPPIPRTTEANPHQSKAARAPTITDQPTQ